MSRRRTAQEVAHILREADRDLAKGLTVPDICRKIGIAQTTYYRWRQQHDPTRSMASAGVASWRLRSTASRSWLPSCS